MYQRRPYQLSILRSFWNLELDAIEIAHTRMKTRAKIQTHACRHPSQICFFYFVHQFRCSHVVPFGNERRRFLGWAMIEATKSEYFFQYLSFLSSTMAARHTHTDFSQRNDKGNEKKYTKSPDIHIWSHLLRFTFDSEILFLYGGVRQEDYFFFFVLEACKFAMYKIWCVYFQFPTNAIFKYASCKRTWRSTTTIILYYTRQ